MKISVTVPGLLAASVGGAREFDVEASTLAEALEVIRRAQSVLRTHIWDESGKIRQHVLVRFDDRAAARRWYDSPEYAALKALRLEATHGDAVLLQSTPSEFVKD